MLLKLKIKIIQVIIKGMIKKVKDHEVKYNLAIASNCFDKIVERLKGDKNVSN